MSVITLEGFVQDGQIRLHDATALPEKARVFVVIPDAPSRPGRVASPRLADPEKVSEFTMEMTEVEPSAEV